MNTISCHFAQQLTTPVSAHWSHSLPGNPGKVQILILLPYMVWSRYYYNWILWCIYSNLEAQSWLNNNNKYYSLAAVQILLVIWMLFVLKGFSLNTVNSALHSYVWCLCPPSVEFFNCDIDKNYVFRKRAYSAF